MWNVKNLAWGNLITHVSVHNTDDRIHTQVIDNINSLLYTCHVTIIGVRESPPLQCMFASTYYSLTLLGFCLLAHMECIIHILAYDSGC